MLKSIYNVRFTTLAAILLLPQLLWASPDLSEYELVFGDDFDGPTLDPEKWNTRYFWGPWKPINGEEQFYIDSLDLNSNFEYSPFSFSQDGVLSITAVIAPETGTGSAPSQPNADLQPNDIGFDENDLFWSLSPDLSYNENYVEGSRKYLSGLITSAQSYNVTHGYFEARLKFPKGQGLWPAFWLLNRQYVERFPEIDIVEFLGHKTDTVHHTMHWIDTFSSEQHVNVSSPTYETIGSDFTTNFHTFGLAWDPKKVSFYVDGELVHEIVDSEFFIPNQSMYLLLNLAVGGTWPGAPDENTSFPASYDIDYVRAYERRSIDVITPSVLEDSYQLMFSDEFNGDALNSDTWNTALLWGPYKRINNEEQVYIDKLGMHQNHPVEPFEVSSGSLKIRANTILAENLPERPVATDPIWNDFPNYQKSNVYPSEDGSVVPDYAEENGWIPSYSSGALTSYDSFKFVNGYAEARIKLPASNELWPAFWLLHGYYNGPQPEIDILEAKGQFSDTSYHSYHYYDYSLNPINGLISSSTEYALPGSGIDDFHIYGLQWDRERIVWYVDGVPVKEVTGQHVSKQLSYVLLNLAVGGDFVASSENEEGPSLPAEMEVDWVRVWQYKNLDINPATNIVLPTPTSENPVVYEYYEGEWNELPNFDDLVALKVGLLPDINMTPRLNEDNFAFRYRVEFEIDVAGVYTFFLRSDDGSQISVDGGLVVDNDGLHAAVTVEGDVYLSVGSHEAVITYFERTAGQQLAVRISNSVDEEEVFSTKPFSTDP